jgi:hypothetical protein
VTEATNVNDIAAMLMQPESEPVTESTEGTEELEVAQTEEAEDYELEAEADGENEETDEADESEEPEYYNVKIDGEDYQVTLEEALAGYQRDSDYRKKTMTVAEQRKEVDAKAAAIDAKLTELDSFIKREEDAVNWEELMRTDPGEYLARKEQLNKAKEAADSVRNERQAEMQQQQNAYINDETTKLITAMGGNDAWNVEQRNADMSLATSYLQGMGLQESEISNIIDHRLWKIVFDAARASKFSETKSRVKKEIRKAPKSVKPGQKVPASQRQRAKATEAIHSAKGRQAQTAALADLLKMGN